MPKPPGLTPEQNDRVRAALRKLLAEYGNQTQLARRLGVNQATISGILAGRQGTSYLLAVKIAKLQKVDERELLWGESPHVKRPADHREEAAQLAREDGVHEAVIESVLAEPITPENQGRSTLWWAAQIKMREAQVLAGGRPSEREQKPARR